MTIIFTIKSKEVKPKRQWWDEMNCLLAEMHHINCNSMSMKDCNSRSNTCVVVVVRVWAWMQATVTRKHCWEILEV